MKWAVRSEMGEMTPRLVIRNSKVNFEDSGRRPRSAMRRCLLILTAIWGVMIPARGQLCTGSLGDPVVHITFGAGNNPGPQLSSASIRNIYVSGDCPNDDYYTIRNKTALCFNNSWHTLDADHTGDPGGYFMLINAAIASGVFYIDTVRGLCNNTTYEFAAWVVNVLRQSACGGVGIDPNLTFNIETTTGDTLATYSTLNIPETSAPTWKQYGLFFKMPPSTSSVVIRITNNAPGGCGNDIALDDITFRPCGPLVQASVALTGDTAIQTCYGNTSSIQLGSTYSSGYADPVFQWQLSFNGTAWIDIPGANGSGYLRGPTNAGVYRYRIAMAEKTNAIFTNCRVASNMVTITVNPLPDPLVSDTTKGCEGSAIKLQASGGKNYAWSGPNGFNSIQQAPDFPNVQPGEAGLYHVMVTDDKGCSKPDSTRLIVFPAVSAAVSNGSSVCEGTGVSLQATGGVTYLWAPSTGLSSANSANPIASPGDTTLYTVTVFSDKGCFDTASVKINIWKKPLANAGPDQKTREGIPVTLTGSTQGTNVSYYWTPASYLNNSSLLQPSANPPEDFFYTLNVISNMGCGINTDKVFVRVYKQVKVPNAFSPNGDGTNDLWIIEALVTYPEADIQVFNRFGQLVFQSHGYSKPWDGTYNGQHLPAGTYYYVIDLKTDVFPVLNGWVLIVR